VKDPRNLTTSPLIATNPNVCSPRFLVVGNSAADVFVELFKQSPAEEYLAKKIKRVVGLPAGRSRKHLAYSYMHTAA